MTTSNEEQHKLPAELLSSLNETRAAIAQQRYADALVILQQGLDRTYDSAKLDGLSLVEHFLGLVWILEFNLQQTKGNDWETKVVKVPEKDTRCSFCKKTYAEAANLISGAEAIICDECVGICNEILLEAKG
jgi:hypothetical protein